jgi:tRNA U34 5-methylaminomethyl-2-thiouridine-forming methyltransferase MnmC
MTKSQISHTPTADGSSTLFSTKYGAHYHSLHGAITESNHIFIEAGLKSLNLQEINILEVGFGTGLNAALTAHASRILGIKVIYHTLELHPLTKDEYSELNYQSSLTAEAAFMWRDICDSLWDKTIRITDNFLIKKINADFTIWNPELEYNLIYFDAFAPDDQPEMWANSQFEKLYNSMPIGGKLVTYSVKGDVKRALIHAGFSLERLDGPPGKKHMLRATKQQRQGEID